MRILGIGTAAPDHDAAQDEAAELHAWLTDLDPARTRTLRALYRKSGVRRRGSVLLERAEGSVRDRQTFYEPLGAGDAEGPTTRDRMARYAAAAPALALRSAERALADAGCTADEVTHLVTVSCTGFMSPGLDARLVHALGLRPQVTRTQVGFMGCHGALNGIRVARGYAMADPDSLTLVCSVELCSLHLAYEWEPESLVANALFADGAAAVVCGGDRVPVRSGRAGGGAAGGSADAPADASAGGGSVWRVAASGTVLLPDSGDDMTWTIGDHGFRMTLSPRVPDVIGRHLFRFLDDWLGAFGTDVTEVGTWAVHPGGPRILDAVEGAMGLDRSSTSVSRAVLAEHGNMSSATVLFILDRVRRAGAPLPCVALAFGPGLVAEVLLVTG